MVNIIEKIHSVSNLSWENRYQYFIRKVADFEVVWILCAPSSVPAALALEQSPEPFFVWPEAEFASQYATGNLASAVATKISLTEFMDAWLPALALANRLVCVFPVPAVPSAPASTAPTLVPRQVLDDITLECQQYE